MAVTANIPHLAYALDLSCPVALPSRPLVGHPWPFPIAGPSTSPDESVEDFFSRRYYETLYLSDILFPLASLVTDLERVHARDPVTFTRLLHRHIIPLGEVENRYRRLLAPVISASFAIAATCSSSTIVSGSSVTSQSDAQRSVLADALESSGLSTSEKEVIAVAVDLRVTSRAAMDGHAGMRVRTVIEELERREVLIQVILILLYRAHQDQAKTIPIAAYATDVTGTAKVATSMTEPAHKKRRHRRETTSSAITPQPHPTDDIESALELLTDRIGVWLAVAELGIGLDEGKKGKDKDKVDERGIDFVLRRFWRDILVPCFLQGHAEFCTAFHLKVFGKPIPAELVPQKKSRKAKVTHRRPSVDHLQHRIVTEPAPPATAVPLRRGSSARGSSPPLDGARITGTGGTLRRSASRTSDSLGPDARRERSRSTDPTSASTTREMNRPQKIIRAPSSKDLFKGREVGLMRRSSSSLLGARSQGKDDHHRNGGGSQSQGQSKDSDSSSTRGLLGRRTGLGESQRRKSLEDSSTHSATHTNTLIFATPSKPKQGSHSIFGPRLSGGGPGGAGLAGMIYHPTPIREEPSSGERERERPSFIAETPVAPGRRASVITETPGANGGVDVGGGDSDNDLAGLMVMTDDEDGYDSGGDGDGEGLNDARGVPETPARRL